MLKGLFGIGCRSRMEKLIEAGVQIGRNTLIFNKERDYGCNPHMVRIGDNCAVTSGVQFITNPAVRKFVPDGKEAPGKMKADTGIVVHDNCFIGMDSIIYPDVVIGPNAIIGAGTVVMNDVQPNMCVCGNPARVVGTLAFYRSTCRRNTIPGYSPVNKRKLLENYFWDNQHS